MAQILVVDDEVGIRELLSEILADEGHHVVLAESASWLFRAAPYIIFATTWVAASLVPTFRPGLLFSWSADLIAITGDLVDGSVAEQERGLGVVDGGVHLRHPGHLLDRGLEVGGGLVI